MNPLRMSSARNTLASSAIALLLASGIPLVSAAPVATATQQQPAQPVAIAQGLLDDMQHARYDAAFARFDDTMKAHVSAAQLKAVWESLPAQVGAFRERGAPVAKHDGDDDMVSFSLVYANGRLVAHVMMNAHGQVIGFVIQPDAAPAPPARSDLPAHEVSFGPAGRTLPGTVLMPKPAGDGKRVAAVVFVHGSGPQDRDEAVGGARVFRDLAEGLADRGIASLRYEKRTKARPQDFGTAYTIDDETTDDAVAAVAFLKTQPGIDPHHIYVVGHSQGAMMAPRIAQHASDVAGIVLLAAPARHLEDVLMDQNRWMAMTDGKIDAGEQAQLDALAKAIADVKAIDAHTPPTKKFLLDLPASYWLSLKDYSPVAVAHAIRQPVLVLQGDRDFQVTGPDWKGWQDAFGKDGRVTIHHYPLLNHLFIPGKGRSSLAEYNKPGHVDARVSADIADWIKAH